MSTNSTHTRIVYACKAHELREKLRVLSHFYTEIILVQNWFVFMKMLFVLGAYIWIRQRYGLRTREDAEEVCD